MILLRVIGLICILSFKVYRKKKIPEHPLLASRVLWDPIKKSMIIISDYTLTYKEESGVFC